MLHFSSVTYRCFFDTLLLPADCCIKVPRFGVGGGQRFQPVGLLPLDQFERTRGVGYGYLSVTQRVIRAGRADPGEVFVGIMQIGLQTDRLIKVRERLMVCTESDWDWFQWRA